MNTAKPDSRRGDLTFKANLKHTRYGWLRLTPAYSVHLVTELLDGVVPQANTPEGDAPDAVLDPFCGTGTTALVCAERGIACDTTDINPFLLWLTRVKTRSYDATDLAAFGALSVAVLAAIDTDAEAPWAPPLHQIEKWWNPVALQALGRAHQAITEAGQGNTPATALDLARVAFCRAMIERSNAAFNHQSMSFADDQALDLWPENMVREQVAASWRRAVHDITGAAVSPVQTQPRAILCDARNLTTGLQEGRYSRVITSPPYPNRMSYIRELRPYMYWLGYLENGRQAGELDWQAIGGTWGVATSNLTKVWDPTAASVVPFEGFGEIVRRISDRSPVLGCYVHKYFTDMVDHCTELFRVVRSGAWVHYIVGNSKFYDVLLPVEEIFARLFEHAGFRNVAIQPIRKRNSKKELIEFLVSAEKPMAAPS